jgi:hypothetical protein
MLPVAVKPAAVAAIVALLVAGGMVSTVVAVMLTFAGGTFVGAVYVAGVPLAVLVGETDPHSVTVQATPLSVRLQSTAPFCRLFDTVAANFVDPFVATKVEVGERPTEIGAAPTVRLSWTSGEVSCGLPGSVT